MVPKNHKFTDRGSFYCYSCKSMYGSLYCDNCRWNSYDSGTEDKYQEDDLNVHTEKLKINPNTLEINVPEGVKSVTINFSKLDESSKTTHYSHIPEESDVGYSAYSCDNCGHHYCVDEGFDIPNYCENCGLRIDKDI